MHVCNKQDELLCHSSNYFAGYFVVVITMVMPHTLFMYLILPASKLRC